MNDHKEKTHYRKAFNSPYLSSADIVGNTVLTVDRVSLDPDKSKRTKDRFNTIYFQEKEIRRGEPLKPMILNSTNNKIMKDLTGSCWIDEWRDIKITIYVDQNVRFGREVVEGLRISPQPPALQKQTLTPDNQKLWKAAIVAYKRDSNLTSVLSKMYISEEHQAMIKEQANA